MVNAGHKVRRELDNIRSHIHEIQRCMSLPCWVEQELHTTLRLIDNIEGLSHCLCTDDKIDRCDIFESMEGFFSSNNLLNPERFFSSNNPLNPSCDCGKPTCSEKKLRKMTLNELEELQQREEVITNIIRLRKQR